MDVNHIGKREAEAEAIRIAVEFVSTHGISDWTCLGSRSDRSVASSRKRRNIVKWTVLFERSIGGIQVDGPGVVRVDLETGEAEFF